MILDRQSELGEIEWLLAEAARRPAGLWLEGPAGIGKTVLLEHGVACALADDRRILMCRPSEPEAVMSFGGLGDLLGGVESEFVDALPPPQRRAIRTAVLRVEDSPQPVDRRTIAIAALEVVRAHSRRSPVLVVIDDAQWLDRASAIVVEFIVRRLGDEPVGVLVGVRAGVGDRPVDGLEREFARREWQRRPLNGLSAAAIGRLVRERLALRLPRFAIRQLHEAADGNPFVALEFARAEQRSHAQTEHGTIDQVLGERLALLSTSGRRVTQVLSVEGRASVDLLLSASPTRRAGESGLAEAEASGIIDIRGNDVRFSHPLIRRAVYRDLSTATRRRLHRKLAALALDSERRARHLAAASSKPDPATAAAVEEAAKQAGASGAPSVAGELWQLAEQTTPLDDSENRMRRRLAAAEHYFTGGDWEFSRYLLGDLVEAMPPGRNRAAVLLRLVDVSWGDTATCASHVDQALAESDGDPRLCIEAHCDRAFVELIAGTIDRGSRSAHQALTLARSAGDEELLWLALVTVAYIDFEGGRFRPRLIAETRKLETQLAVTSPRFGWAGNFHGRQLMCLGRLAEAETALRRGYEAALSRGDEASRWQLARHWSELESRTGNWQLAARLAAEADEIERASGHDRYRAEQLYANALIAALIGRVEDARWAAGDGLTLAERQGDRQFAIANRWVLGFTELSTRQYARAREILEPLPAARRALGLREPALYPYQPDLIEVLLRSGDLPRARDELNEFADEATAFQRPAALAALARCEALAAAAEDRLDTAAAATITAIDTGRLAGQPFELGRSLLVAGEVHRRLKHKRRARELLGEALQLFDQLGAACWSQAAENELARISGRRPGQVMDVLTATERQIAQLVAVGQTNREASAALSLSENTVETYLSRIYRKLGVRSRTELSAWLASEDPSRSSLRAMRVAPDDSSKPERASTD
jgi:DNA-binding CsgD family transcriptional regulator